MFYDNVNGLVRVIVVGPLAYFWLIAVLRVTGKRTLSQLNAFDFIVTVALGSTLATVVLTGTVALAEGILALALLAVVQLGAAWLSVRLPRLRGLLTSQPTLLLRDGCTLDAAMTRERITEQGIRQAIRGAGIGGLELVAAVVLETNGKICVIPQSELGSGSALGDISIP